MGCMCRKANEVDVHLDRLFNELNIVDKAAVSIRNQDSMLFDSTLWPGPWFKYLAQPVQCDPRCHKR